jgi:hypothetical protein
MDICRLRLKLGQNEFEAQGPQDYVEKQREIFLARVDAGRNSEPAPETANLGEATEPSKLDLGNGNTVVASSSNLHATWKI